MQAIMDTGTGSAKWLREGFSGVNPGDGRQDRRLIKSAESPGQSPASPIIAGEAVKGPTAKIMKELRATPSPLAVLEHYRGLVNGMVLDECDAGLVDGTGLPVRVCNTLMRSLEDRERVARCALELAAELS
jgi:2-phospho-L-lactate transferase/gluconeogenesis factor (CofD/UPF0052 family)